MTLANYTKQRYEFCFADGSSVHNSAGAYHEYGPRDGLSVGGSRHKRTVFDPGGEREIYNTATGQFLQYSAIAFFPAATRYQNPGARRQAR